MPFNKILLGEVFFFPQPYIFINSHQKYNLEATESQSREGEEEGDSVENDPGRPVLAGRAELLILLSEVWGFWVGVGWGLLGLSYSTRLIQPAIIIHFLLIDH